LDQHCRCEFTCAPCGYSHCLSVSGRIPKGHKWIRPYNDGV